MVLRGKPNNLIDLLLWVHETMLSHILHFQLALLSESEANPHTCQACNDFLIPEECFPFLPFLPFRAKDRCKYLTNFIEI